MQEIRVHFVNIGSPDRPATGVKNWRIASRHLGYSCMTTGLVQATGSPSGFLADAPPLGFKAEVNRKS